MIEYLLASRASQRLVEAKGRLEYVVCSEEGV